MVDSMTGGYETSYGTPESEAEAWFRLAFNDRPEIGMLASDRADDACRMLAFFIAEDGDSPPPQADLEQLRLGVQRLIFSFTDPENPDDAVKNRTIAAFIMGSFEQIETGDVGVLARYVDAYIPKAHSAIEYLQLAIKGWDAYDQDERFMAAVGRVFSVGE